jgi:hypothetical protein
MARVVGGSKTSFATILAVLGEGRLVRKDLEKKLGLETPLERNRLSVAMNTLRKRGQISQEEPGVAGSPWKLGRLSALKKRTWKDDGIDALELLRSGPMSLKDLCAGLKIGRARALKVMGRLKASGEVKVDGRTHAAKWSLAEWVYGVIKSNGGAAFKSHKKRERPSARFSLDFVRTLRDQRERAMREVAAIDVLLEGCS